MGKIHLVSWRRKDRILGETETVAQRRARKREKGETSGWPLTSITAVLGNETGSVLEMPQQDGIDMLTTVANTTPELTEEDLADIVIPDILGGVRETPIANEKPSDDAVSSTVLLELTLAQSQTVRALPLTVHALSAPTSSLRCQLIEFPHHGNVILRLVDQPKSALNVMSLRDVSELLNVSRKTIMRLVQDGTLRHQRLANRYVFAAEDVRTLQSQRLAAQTLTRE